MVRQGCRVVIMLVVLVALLCPSPAYAQIVDGGAGRFVRVKAGTSVTVLGLHHEPANPHCHPPTLDACKPHTYAVAQLPNGEVVLLPNKAVNYRTQTVRVGGFSFSFGPRTPGEVSRHLGLTDTGGVAISPLLGAVILIGSVLVARRMLQ